MLWHKSHMAKGKFYLIHVYFHFVLHAHQNTVMTSSYKMLFVAANTIIPTKSCIQMPVIAAIYW